MLAARALLPLLIALAALTLASSAGATTIALSSASSDDTPASLLDASFAFSITGASELTLTVSNTTSSPDAFNIDGIWFNAASHVGGLALVSATHSAAGDVTAGWAPVLTHDKVAGFGHFDFGLTDGVGETNPNLIGPGEIVTFVFSISGTGPYAADDFVALTEKGYSAAAKFVNGPGDDSAFGASAPGPLVPEPASAALLAAGLLGTALARRR